MPELPEVEHLRRTLEPVLIGARVDGARVHRTDVLRRATNGPGRIGLKRRPNSTALLDGSTIVDLKRHGKQLAIIADTGSVVCVHLGMSGQLRYVQAGTVLPRDDHIHCRWSLRRGTAHGELAFRDPRRFGGVWVARNLEELERCCWSALGPDALRISSAAFQEALRRTQRAVKVALLDQRIVAGVGNIYADECLFDARINPTTVASSLSKTRVIRLHESMIDVLQRAINCSGSTLRDYIDGNGSPGSFAHKHNVYGRGGSSCTRCGGKLVQIVVGQRTTVYCSRCQKR